MSSKYSAQDKKEALDALADCDNHYAQVAEKTGIPASTLREWVVRHHEQRIERLQTKIKHLHELLADNSLHLVKAIDDAIDGASLSQLSSALGVNVDRYLKLHDHLAESGKAEQRGKYQIEYIYGGKAHSTPPWAAEDSEYEEAFQSGGLWQEVRQDRTGQDSNNGKSPGGSEMLVVGPDLSNGRGCLARPEDATQKAAGGAD